MVFFDGILELAERDLAGGFDGVGVREGEDFLSEGEAGVLEILRLGTHLEGGSSDETERVDLVCSE